MKKMTKLERVLATFEHQETDRVPLYDLMLNDDCIEYFTGSYPPYGEEGAKLQAQAVDKMLDMARGVGVSPHQPPIEFTDDPTLLEWARYGSLTYRYNPIRTYESAIDWVKNQIQSLSKWRENVNLQKASEDTRMFFEKLYSWMSEDHVVCCLRQSGVGLDDIRGTIGIEFFSYLDADDPGLISEYLELYTEREVAIIHAIADPKISPFALTYGDIAMKAKLLHSPQWLRREFFPRLKRLNDAYHEHSIKCLFHSDGYLMEVMPDLIETGIDGINPIEIVAGMDVGEIYRLYHDKIFLTGGIDMSQLLSNGTPDQVREVCRKTISSAPTGYFMGSTTELDNSSRLENILAMIEVSWGYYPPGAKPDIMEQIRKRKEEITRKYQESFKNKQV
ncbi:MAG: uroporphyrinogen decarboxylase family protein [Candidatus Poribacteria bacterium]